MKKQVILKITVLLLCFTATDCLFSQNAKLVYDCKQNDNDYVANLCDINGRLFFVSGKFRNPKGIGFCGHIAPRKFMERHVYEYDFAADKAEKIFHHNLENDFARPGQAVLDSSEILNKHTYFALTDEAGVFLPQSRDSSYWLLQDNDFTKKDLPTGQLINDYYPRKINGKWKVQGKIGDNSGHLWTFDTVNFNLQKAVRDTFLLQRHNYNYWEDKVIFHAYAKLYGKDNGLYLEKTPGEIIKISRFPTASVFANYQTIFRDKIIYRVTHRGVPGSYSNTDFNNTELWSYDVEKDTSERIWDFEKYCLTYSATVFNDNLYLTYGVGAYRLFQLGVGDITEKYAASENLQSVAPYLYPFNDKLYFIGKDSSQTTRLYVLDKENNIRCVNNMYRNVKIVETTDDRLYFLSAYFDDNRFLFSISAKTGSIEQHSFFKNAEEVRFDPLIIDDKTYWFVSQNNRTNLYVTSADKPRMELVLKDIAYQKSYKEKTYFIKDEKLYVLAASIDSESLNQIWKIE